MSEIIHPLKVFLYHVPADRNRVRDLYLRLINDGLDAWLMKEKILPGQDWEQEIQRAVLQADVVVVCLSRRFDQGGSRQSEIQTAFDSAIEQLEEELFIVPVCLEECERLINPADWLSLDSYENPAAPNPVAPDSGQYRVWRGGSWANTSPERVRTYSRTGNLPTDTSSGIGVRCAREAAP